MRWTSDLYLGLDIREDAGQCRKNIESGEGAYMVLTLSPNGKDQLDIRTARSMLRPALESLSPLIVGVAKDRKDALRLLERIASDCYFERKDADLRAYLTDRLKRSE